MELPLELIFVLAVPVAFALYCLPIGVAWTRRLHERPMAFVMIVDLLFGWTIVGWVAALAVACLGKRFHYSRKRLVKRARWPSSQLRQAIKLR